MKGSNLGRIRDVNVHAILDAIYDYGPISRTEIAEYLSLTPPAITFNVAPLLESGLLYEFQGSVNKGESRLGRPRVLLDFRADAFYVIGVDIGPFATYICLTDIRGNALMKEEHPVCPSDYDAALRYISSVIAGVLDSSPVPRERIVGICLGIPGFVDNSAGVLRYGSVSKWRNKAVGVDISALVGLPCILENNARCRALSVEMFGDDHLPDTYVYLFIARGIGCQLKIGKRAYTGAGATAGEIGHMVLDRKGPLCPTCGNHGCLEAFSSEVSIRNNCIAMMESGRETLLSSICPDPHELTTGDILEAEKAGDKEVCRIMDDAMVNLGIALANAINILSPPLVLVDGYVMKVQRNVDTFMASVQDNLFGVGINEVDIRFVEFNKFRTAYGAAAKAIRIFVLKEKE